MVCHFRKKREKLAGRKSIKVNPLEVKEVDPLDEVSTEALPPWYFNSWSIFFVGVY
jgi:hypothetical protein